jgi:hypothetical protein
MLKGRFESMMIRFCRCVKTVLEKRQGLVDCLALPLNISPVGIGWFTAYLIRLDPAASK